MIFSSLKVIQSWQRKEYENGIFITYFKIFKNLFCELDLEECEILFALLPHDDALA